MVFGTKGAVACEHPLAALMGIRLLDSGGTPPTDACVAMAASLTVLVPTMTGMGDAFLLFYEAEAGYVRGANGAGRAPRSAIIEELRSNGLRSFPSVMS